jgi:hypothetical protein
MERRSVDGSEEMLNRICGEYVEMPGLRLTCAQAGRLWGLEAQVCQTLLEALVETKFLWRAKDGAYGRLTDGIGPNPPLRMAKADVDSKAIWGRSRNGLPAASGERA